MNEGTSEKPIMGRPPTADEQYLINATKLLQADKAVERLDSHAKFLFSTVSIVGTLLTGFGIFSPMGATLLQNKWMLLPIGLACLSLALAMVGLTPWLRNVRLNDLGSVRDYYNSILTYRGIFITSSSIIFAVSLLSVALVAAFLKPEPLTPAISVRLSGAGQKTMLNSKIEFHHVPRSGLAETQILGFKVSKTGVQEAILFKDTTTADTSGKITVSAELDNIQKYSRFVIASRAMSDSKLLCEKKVEIKR